MISETVKKFGYWQVIKIFDRPDFLNIISIYHSKLQNLQGMDITALKAVYNYAFRLNLISKSEFL